VLFNVIVGGLVAMWAYMSFEVVAGLFWFLAKVLTFVFIFAWIRGTLPRVRIDQLMGWAWKWLVEASLLNIFVTAGAILILDALARR
jgi:NADH-quinone oxidoreductase subunit H